MCSLILHEVCQKSRKDFFETPRAEMEILTCQRNPFLEQMILPVGTESKSEEAEMELNR